MEDSGSTKVPARINDPMFMKEMSKKVIPSRLAYYDKIDLLMRTTKREDKHGSTENDGNG